MKEVKKGGTVTIMDTKKYIEIIDDKTSNIGKTKSKRVDSSCDENSIKDITKILEKYCNSLPKCILSTNILNFIFDVERYILINQILWSWKQSLTGNKTTQKVCAQDMKMILN